MKFHSKNLFPVAFLADNVGDDVMTTATHCCQIILDRFVGNAFVALGLVVNFQPKLATTAAAQPTLVFVNAQPLFSFRLP